MPACTASPPLTKARRKKTSPLWRILPYYTLWMWDALTTEGQRVSPTRERLTIPLLFSTDFFPLFLSGRVGKGWGFSFWGCCVLSGGEVRLTYSMYPQANGQSVGGIRVRFICMEMWFKIDRVLLIFILYLNIWIAILILMYENYTYEQYWLSINIDVTDQGICIIIIATLYRIIFHEIIRLINLRKYN